MFENLLSVLTICKPLVELLLVTKIVFAILSTDFSTYYILDSTIVPLFVLNIREFFTFTNVSVIFC